MRDKVLSMAQFEAMEEREKWNAGSKKREARIEKKHNRRETELAIIEARAREMGLHVGRGWNKRDLYLPHWIDLNDELTLEFSHAGSYCYVVLARRGAARGRFSAAELHLLIDALRNVRLPYRKPYAPRKRKALKRAPEAPRG